MSGVKDKPLNSYLKIYNYKQLLSMVYRMSNLQCKWNLGVKYISSYKSVKFLTLTSFSESPRHLLTMLDAEMLKKVVLHSVATALASNVLPVPN